MGLGFEHLETAGVPVVVVRMAGVLDESDRIQAESAFDRLLAEGVVRYVADLAGLEFLNSSLLGLLVRVGRRARDGGGDLVLTTPPPFARRVLATLGIDRRFAIVDSAAEGVRRLTAHVRGPDGPDPLGSDVPRPRPARGSPPSSASPD